MILSVSRRTDIPAFYSEWFFNRVKEGFVYVRNPLNIHLVSRISLDPNLIDCIVFWSKNPKPMLNRLSELKKYMYYFQFTVNAYGTDIEAAIPSKNDIIIPAFQKLSQIIGPNRVIWRYDPILLTAKYNIEYHIHYFDEIAKNRIAVEPFLLLGNWEHTFGKSKDDIFYYHDYKVFKGCEWWKSSPSVTDTFSTIPFLYGYGLFNLLSGLYKNKCKYEQ